MKYRLSSYDKYVFVLSFFKKNSLDYVIFDIEKKIQTESYSDIDVIVCPKFNLKDLLDYFIRCNCDILNIIRNDSYDQVYIINNNFNTIIHIDLIKKNSLRGIEIIDTKDFFENKYINDDKFHFVDKLDLYYFELMKSLLFCRNIPDKYFNSISNIYSEKLKKKIIRNHGLFFNNNILKLLNNEKINFNFQLNFIKNSIINNPKNLFNLIYHYFALVKRYINYPGIYIVIKEFKDFKLVNELFTGVEFIDKPNNILEKVKNTIKLFRFRGELKLIVSNDNNFTFFKPNIRINNKDFNSEILNFMVKRVKQD